MSISKRSVGSVGSVRRTVTGAAGAAGVAVTMLFGTLPSAEARTSGPPAAPATVSTAVMQTAFEVPMARPVQLADPPEVTGITNTIATDFHTAPMPDWWGTTGGAPGVISGGTRGGGDLRVVASPAHIGHARLAGTGSG